MIAANGLAVLNYFERRVRRDDAPDLLANVMLVAWRRIGVIPDDPEQARMWLFGIARNVLLEHRRSEGRRLRLADRVRSLTSPDDIVTAPTDEHAEVLDAVNRLPPDQRELVYLVHWDGFSLSEAAAHVGINASTIRNRYQRAKQQLRDTLLPDPSMQR